MLVQDNLTVTRLPKQIHTHIKEFMSNFCASNSFSRKNKNIVSGKITQK